MDDENRDGKSSFLGELQSKLKCGLKPTTTKTTYADGTVHYTSVQGSSYETARSEKTFGFVVDEQPDLTIGQVTPWLFVSSQDVPCDQKILTDYRISHILSLLPGFVLPPEVVKIVSHHLVLDIYDEHTFSLDSDIVCHGFQFINDARKDNGKILVHCNAGISRAPSFVIAYLMKCEKLLFESAWEKVKSVRPVMRPNDGFVKQLQEMNMKYNN